MHELRRTGKSPGDIANLVMAMLHLKYEQAHLAYLHSVENVKDGEAGVHGHQTIAGFIRGGKLLPLVATAVHMDGVVCPYQDSTSQTASYTNSRGKREILISSSSYAVMNENRMILSWVMVQLRARHHWSRYMKDWHRDTPLLENKKPATSGWTGTLVQHSGYRIPSQMNTSAGTLGRPLMVQLQRPQMAIVQTNVHQTSSSTNTLL